jgi:hypothetical protein
MCVFCSIPSACDSKCGHLKPLPLLSDIYLHFQELPQIQELECFSDIDSCAEKVAKLLSRCQDLAVEVDYLFGEVQAAKSTRNT